MKNRLTALILFVFFANSSQLFSQNNLEKAKNLAKNYIIVDGHVDLPYRLKVKNFRMEKEFVGIPIASESGDFDFKRAKKGGLDAPIMNPYDDSMQNALSASNALLAKLTLISTH